MGVSDYNGLKKHIGHKVVVAWYGDKKSPANVSIECETCSEVIMDFDK